MRYSEIEIETPFTEEYLEDMFFQGLADLGFESFYEGKAYIQTDLLNEAAVRHYCQEQGVQLLVIRECPDENWNATWEAEHPVEELPMGIRIVPHCAFGAGHHETTSMMVEQLIENQDRIAGLRVLDQGCGTGVLGIFTKHLGAAEVVAVDIDDKSVVNTQENAALNNVELDVRLGSVVPEGLFDLILANIHRNILLQMMPDFATRLPQGGQVWLSGFYEEDIPALLDAATHEGLRHVSTHARGDWRMLQLTK